VIPKEHYETMREMPPVKVGELFVSVAKVMRGVFKATKADGINIGQSNGAAASQDVFHMHVHVIPRHTGDSPRGMTFPERKRTAPADMERIGEKVRDAIAHETT
jgi:histidine triad (HIT) family protein